MKIKWKIAMILISVVLLSNILVDIAYSMFFMNYVKGQENSQINTIKESIAAYIDSMTAKYLGNTNDWAHWDDTYDYINGDDNDYVENNLAADTFENLDVNFIIFLNKENDIINKFYYDFNTEDFSGFTDDFLDGFRDVIMMSGMEDDTSDIMYIGDKAYFIAVSDVTDSKIADIVNGKMVIGRLFEEEAIAGIEKMADAGVTLSKIRDADIHEPGDGIMLHDISVERKDNAVTIKLIIPNTYRPDSSIMVTVTKNRDLYTSALKNIFAFSISFMLIFIVLSIAIFLLLGIYMSRPFVKLVDEVKEIDLKENILRRINETGKDEFAFLRRSINSMLERIEIEKKIVQDSEEKLRITLTSVGDGVIAVNRDGMIEFMNPIALQLTGYTAENVYERSFESIFEIVDERTREKLESPVKRVLDTNGPIELDNNTILISRDGTERLIEDSAAPIRDKAGSVVGCVIIFRDHSEKREKQKQIEYLSYCDQLTGLYNRRFFEDELRRLDTSDNLPLSIVFADINGLKTINDAFGHQYGDQLIQEVSESFKRGFRKNDFIARTGGDEFIILLPKTSGDLIQNMVERIKERIDTIKIMNINVSISAGWETKHSADQSVWDVLKTAEKCMYQKKILQSASKRNEAIRSILNALLLKSPREDAHSKRVSMLCVAIGEAYDLGDDEINELKVAGELHDIGKIAVDEAILNKGEKMTDADWIQIKSHPETGYRLLGTSKEYYNIAGCVLAHHERWDGTGYPNGLRGEEITWKARVIALADAYDAMTSDRPYRKALSEAEAVSEVRKNAGRQFDPDIVIKFIEKVLHAE